MGSAIIRGFNSDELDKNINWKISTSNLPNSNYKDNEILKSIGHQNFGNLEFPFSHWRLYKQDQWTQLHRSFVKFLRDSPTAGINHICS